MSAKGKLAVALSLVMSLAVPGAAQAAPQPRDVTGDGFADVLTRDDEGRLWLFPNSRTDEPWSWTDREIVGSDMNYVDAMFFADVNLDGLDDLVVREPTAWDGSLWAVKRDKDDVSWTTRSWIGRGWNIGVSLGAGDLNDDGMDDLVLRSPDGALWAYPHSGSPDGGSYPTRHQIGANWQHMTALRMADVTGDDRPDLVARDKDGFLWIFPYTNELMSTKGTTEWTFGARAADPYPAGAGWEEYDQLFLTDVTGDGRIDAVGRDGEGALWVYPHNGAEPGKNPWPDRFATGDWWGRYTMMLG